MKTITLFTSKFDKTNSFSVRFDYDISIAKRMKMIGGVWNENSKTWQLKKNPKNIRLVQSVVANGCAVQNQL
ncbi:MAG: hypothetical protein MRY83_19350 [Flavobacteriales bacterium]|nr:hypothetical protein [Flavobacteriales bacterium]